MIRRIKPPGWILIFILIFLITGGINKLASPSSEVLNQEKSIQAEEIQEGKMIRKHPKIHLKTVTKETKSYTLSISKPYIDSEKVNDTIGKWIKKQKELFIKEVDNDEGLWTENKKAHMNIQMDTHRITETYYSLVFRKYIYSGGANGQNVVKVFNIDIENDLILKIDDVLNLNDKNLENMKKVIWLELQKDIDLESYLDEESFNRSMERPENWEWSIDRHAFTLYWDEYEIAAGAAGAIEVEIPIEKVYVFLHKDVDTYLKMPQSQQLEKEKIIQKEKTKLDPAGKYVALTFDDGPSEKVTPKVLEVLKEHHAKATFFMLGNQVDFYPNLVRKVAEEGHEIGNHSKSHPDLSGMSATKIEEELEYVDKRIEEITGMSTKLIRPPYGAYNDSILEFAEKNRKSIILWSVDSLDWKIRDLISINSIVQNNVTSRSIVLLHDIHSSTADALPMLLEALKQEGYQFVTVSQLLELNEELGTGPYFGKVK